MDMQAFFIIGIQLLPITPISEERDGVEWVRRVYPDIASSCTDECVSSGWSIQKLALLATGGHSDLAFEEAKGLISDVFDTPGGNGHSMTNTLWYIATRPTDEIIQPVPIPPPEDGPIHIDCDKPATCTPEVLGRMAGEYTCEARILWLMTAKDFSEKGACEQVAAIEYPDVCNGC